MQCNSSIDWFCNVTERVIEDHEHLVTDVMVNWTRDTSNRLLFSERREKYALFRNPQVRGIFLEFGVSYVWVGCQGGKVGMRRTHDGLLEKR